MFRNSTGQGMANKVTRALSSVAQDGSSGGYFTPHDESPFSELDDDQPEFSVGFEGPTVRGPGAHTLMSVWDRGDRREVVIEARHTFGNRRFASRATNQLVGGFESADPEVEIFAMMP